MRVAIVFVAMVLVLSGISFGIRAAGHSGGELARVKEPATTGGRGPGAVAKGEPAMAEVVFEKPVKVEEALSIVGRENRSNITTMDGSFRAGAQEIGDSFSVPPRLETAEGIERAWTRARTGSLVDMSRAPRGPVMEEPGVSQNMSDKMDDELSAQAAEMKDAIKDPGTREIRVTKVSLEDSSLDLRRLPAKRSGVTEDISVTTRSDLMEMIERVGKEAKRRGEPSPEFD